MAEWWRTMGSAAARCPRRSGLLRSLFATRNLPCADRPNGGALDRHERRAALLPRWPMVAHQAARLQLRRAERKLCGIGQLRPAAGIERRHFHGGSSPRRHVPPAFLRGGRVHGRRVVTDVRGRPSLALRLHRREYSRVSFIDARRPRGRRCGSAEMLAAVFHDIHLSSDADVPPRLTDHPCGPDIYSGSCRSNRTSCSSSAGRLGTKKRPGACGAP